MDTEKCSIVITTYNGKSFIEEQLESIRMQTRIIHEVLIFDDRSTDNTAEVVQNYIKKYQLQWKFFINNRNYGWQENFMRGIAIASGDIVFLCDQDDIWYPNKCDLMISVFKKYSSCNLLLSNFILFNKMDGRVHNIKPNYSFHDKYQSNNGVVSIKCTARNLLSVLRPGCTYAFRKIFFDKMQLYWYFGLPHDQFLYTMGLITGTAFILQQETTLHRIHDRNNSPKSSRTLQQMIESAESNLKLCQNSKILVESKNLEQEVLQNVQPSLKVLEAFLTERLRYYRNPSYIKWFLLIVRYYRIYPKFATCVKELFAMPIFFKLYSAFRCL